MSAPPARLTARVRLGLLLTRRLWQPLVVTLAALAAAVAGAPQAPAATAAVFTPGTAWQDTSGAPLQLHGLGIVKSGSTW
jgi:hypothetical protein